jgi:hypothetical protein
MKIDGWAINVDGAEIWLTNPYGIDVGFYANSADACIRILERIDPTKDEVDWHLHFSNQQPRLTEA